MSEEFERAAAPTEAVTEPPSMSGIDAPPAPRKATGRPRKAQNDVVMGTPSTVLVARCEVPSEWYDEEGFILPERRADAAALYRRRRTGRD